MPDTFFRNERRGAMHNVLVPNLYVRIYADGTVLFSIRVSLTLSCPMNLKLYPLDTQKCPMQIASCKYFSPYCQTLHDLSPDGWATDDLVYIWKEKNPVQMRSPYSRGKQQIFWTFIISDWEGNFSASFCDREVLQ